MIRSPLLLQSDFCLKYEWHLYTTPPSTTSENANWGEKRSLLHRQMKDLILFLEYILFLTSSKNSMLISETQMQGRTYKSTICSAKIREGGLIGNYRWQQWKRKQASWFLRTAKENSVDREAAQNQEVSLEVCIGRKSWFWFSPSMLSFSLEPLSSPFTNRQSPYLLESVVGYGW